jgi:hypothetical protein
MPNVNAANGFRPVRHNSGGVIRSNPYKLASGTSNAIYKGDPVKVLNTGLLDRAAGTEVIAGIFQGVRWVDPDGTPRWSNYWPAGQTTKGSEAAIATVIDDKGVVFEVQCKTGTAFAQTHVGNNADFEYVAGDAATGISRSVLDISAAAAATANIRILGLIDRVGNELGDSARVEVLINEHLNTAAAGI